jgi:putative addiction module component (TIGR02574 family)
MASKLEDVEQAALDLPVKERARLVTRLVASLEADVDEEVELAWAEETERRYQEALGDPSATEPAAQAFQRARDALR